MSRKATVQRQTKETKISASLTLEGDGTSQIHTGIGFFDHVLTAFGKHGLFAITLACEGDLHVDCHHSVEDVGICLGRAVAQAVGDGAGITRFGTAFVPMDEALVMVSLDISGRPYLQWDMHLPQCNVGALDTSLVEEFMRSFVVNAGITLHVRQLSGTNAHHSIEAAFKALGRALRSAVTVDPQISGVMSTKGALDVGK